MSAHLSRRQRDVLFFIFRCDFPPTIREICKHLGLSPNSTQAAHEHLVALETKGYIKRIPNRARAIVLTPAGRVATVRLTP